MRPRLPALALAAALMATALMAGPVAAQAHELDGQWQRSTGTSRLQFEAADGGLSSRIVWIRPGVKTPAHVGQQIFFGLVPDGDHKWRGKAFNPEDGKTYSGLVIRDGDTLVTKGCILGGLICKSESWTRVQG